MIKNIPLKINLQFADIDKFYIGDMTFTAKNRETYTILKDTYLKRNDRIQVLYYHQKEMDMALGGGSPKNEKGKISLKIPKILLLIITLGIIPYTIWVLIKKHNTKLEKVGNRILLFIEKYSNNFGLSWALPLFWLTVLNSIFVLVFYENICLKCFWLEFFKSLLPYTKLDESLSTKQQLFTIIKNLLNVFLIYQFIVSLRKYSRKL